ncbi:MAG: cytochrome [Actinomycetia bacterium]|nr:cytochrome [Actinomycetes bacterium]
MENGHPEGDIVLLSPGECPVHNVRKMDDVLKIVRSKHIANIPDAFAAAAVDPVNGELNIREFLYDSIMYLDGDRHKNRRKLLNQLVQPDEVTTIREEILLPAADVMFERVASEPDADGVRHMDLVEFLERIFLHLTAKLIGLAGIDTEEGLARLRSCAGPLAAGTSSGFLEDREVILEKAVEAKARYRDEFFRPGRARMEEMLAEVAAGTRDEADVPVNWMRFVVEGADPAYADEDTAIIESTLLLAASVGTSTQSIIQTVGFLQDWFEKHPEDYERRTDLMFLLDALQETVRLRAPFSPFTTRVAATDCEIAGTELTKGQELHIEWVAANRDTSVFGDDANEFNPYRPSPTVSGLQRYGVGFGTGIHQCLGLRLVLGTEGKGGAHIGLLQKLFLAGVKPDPDGEPEGLKLNPDKFWIEQIPRYTKYPVLVTNWNPQGD